jgi:hypothetical protein
VVEAKEVKETSFPVESDNKDKSAEQKPFDFILICAGIKRAAPVKDRY